MHGDAQGGKVGAPDAAAQLMKLRETELLSVEDHHEGRFGDIDADLDDGRGDEERGTPGRKVLHDLCFHGRGVRPVSS